MRSPDAYYDAILTASDSSEIRLKPHRDLYSIALHRLGLSPDDFDAVLGLEDSESGLIAIRGAGIGLAVAVPFAQTRGHDLAAAAKINHGGLPELMFEDHFCLALA
jgi:beta-phosphoglucomutase-like phosphatase (HAD superfamily)